MSPSGPPHLLLEDGFDDDIPVDSSCAYVPTYICVQIDILYKDSKKIPGLQVLKQHETTLRYITTEIAESSNMFVFNNPCLLWNFGQTLSTPQDSLAIFDHFSTGSWRYDRAQVPSR